MLITSHRGYALGKRRGGDHTESFSFSTAYRILVGCTCRFFVRVHTPEDDMMQERGWPPTTVYALKHSSAALHWPLRASAGTKDCRDTAGGGALGGPKVGKICQNCQNQGESVVRSIQLGSPEPSVYPPSHE